MNNKTIHMVTFSLLVVGGLNWLLVAFGFNLVEFIAGMLGSMSAGFSMIVYILVGLSAIYEVVIHKANCKMCNAGGGM